MKTTFFLVLAIIFCIAATATADPTIMISDYTLTPGVLYPGDMAELHLTLSNGETTHTIQSTSTVGGTTTIRTDMVSATIDKLWMLPAYDGSYQIRAAHSFSDLGDIAPGTSLPISMKIIADDNISNGWYFPKIAVDVESYEDVRYPIPVKVSDATVDILLTNVPSKISIGGETPITLTVVNKRESTVDSVFIQPETRDELDITPNSIAVGSLDTDATHDVTFSLKPKQAGIYNLSFDLLFQNGENDHQTTVSFPIEIIQTLDVAPVFYGDVPQVPLGGSSRIRLEVYNAKTTEISGVIVTPITDALVSPSQYFIGSMDPDDVFSVTFDIYPGSLTQGNHSMGFQVTFKQGEEYYESPLAYKSFQIVPMQEVASGPGIGMIVGVLLIIMVSILIFWFFVWKRRFRS